MDFQYPLTLTFQNKDDHIQHVNVYQKFYNEVLKTVNLEIKQQLECSQQEAYEQIEIEKKKAERAEKDREKKQKKTERKQKKLTEIEKEKAEKAQKDQEEQKKLVEVEKKKAERAEKDREEAEKDREEQKRITTLERRKTKQLTSQLAKKEETVKQAEHLIQKKELYDSVQSPAKGKTFEECIKFALNRAIEDLNVKDYTIDKESKNHSCDIRIDVPSLGTIAIEAKDKKKVNKPDMNKFNLDRSKNQFAGSVFWSKTSKIPETTDTGPRKSGQNYLWIDPQNKCLYIRGEQMDRIAHIIFTYIDFLKVLNQQVGDATVLEKNIQIMFDMMSSQYKAFCTLKKEFEKVDKTFENNLDIVKKMCQPQKPNISPMKKGNSSTEIGYASDSKPSPLKKTKSSPQPRSNVAPAINNLTAVPGGSEI